MKASTVSESRYKTATIAEGDTLSQVLQITQENKELQHKYICSKGQTRRVMDWI